MVKIAIAGGSGNVATEIIDVLLAANRYDILLLSRKDIPSQETRHGVSWVKTDYQDKVKLSEALEGVHTVLSFITVQLDPGCISQRNLIDAAIQANVKRFAPSEWATSNFEHLPFYEGKAEIRKYLKELNKDEKVLEYCLFQPGLFTNYLTHPFPSAVHFSSFETHIDLKNRRAFALEGGDDDVITLTTVQDLANVVARAIEFEGEWPVVGGIKGTDLTINQVLALGERVRGNVPFSVTRVSRSDLEAGIVNSTWLPTADHPGIPRELADSLAPHLVSSMLLAISAGAIRVSDEWNRLLPDYKFMGAEEFLTEAWKGKP